MKGGASESISLGPVDDLAREGNRPSMVQEAADATPLEWVSKYVLERHADGETSSGNATAKSRGSVYGGGFAVSPWHSSTDPEMDGQPPPEPPAETTTLNGLVLLLFRKWPCA